MNISYSNVLARAAAQRAIACAAAKARESACHATLEQDLKLGATVALVAFFFLMALGVV